MKMKVLVTVIMEIVAAPCLADTEKAILSELKSTVAAIETTADLPPFTFIKEKHTT